MRRLSNIFAGVLIALLSVIGTVLAGDRAKIYEVRIIEKLIWDATKKSMPKVYIVAPDKEAETLRKDLIRYARKIKVVVSIDKADFILVKNVKKPIKINKPALALDFSSLEYCPVCIGVFAWKNGRPMLLLYRDKLLFFKIELPDDYKYFIEDKANY